MTRHVLRGRSKDLAAVMAALRRASRTHAGALVLITGEPGIGKSAVLRAVAEQANRAGWRVGLGKTEEIEQIAPGAPLLLALRSGPDPLLDGAGVAGMASLSDRQLWLVERINVVLEDAASRSPVIVAIDDVQWADRLTRFALRVLPDRLATLPLVWVLSSRLAPAAVADEVVAAVEDVVPVTRIRLGELPPEDIDDLARDRLGTEPSASVRTLLRSAGGNPFWAVQLLDGLAWREAHGVDDQDVHTELVGGVHRRLALVDPGTADLVRLAAVWGRHLTFDDARGVLDDVPGGAVATAFREAADYGLLVSTGSGVEFSHDLLRAAAYADIARDERNAWHRRCARHLLEHTTTALPAAAHLRVVATPGDEEAVDTLLRAASESVATMPDQAAELAQEAFGLVVPGSATWLPTGERAIAVLRRVQRDGAVLPIADRLIAGTRDAETGALLQVQACRALWATGACHEIERRVDLTVRGSAVSPQAAARLRAIRALASTRTEAARSAAAAAEQALAEGRRLGDETAQHLALLALAEAATNEGRHRVVLDRFRQLRAVGRVDDVVGEVRALQHLDRYDEAATLLDKLRHDVADDKLLPSYLYAQIWQDHNLARFDAAEAGARTLLRLAWETENFGHEITARMVLAAVQLYRGDVGQARDLLRPAEAREEYRDELRASRLRLVQGWLTAEEGDLEGALAVLRPLVAAATDGLHAWCWSPPWMRTFAGIGLAAGDPDFVAHTVAIARLGAGRNPGVATMAGVALQLDGLVRGDLDAAAGAVEVLRRSPRRLLLAQATADHAAALDAAGDAAGAATRHHEAAVLFAALGVVPGALAGTVVRRAATSTRTASRRPSHGLASLTPTEVRVAELVTAGHSSRSAAAELGVSINTVNAHLRAVFVKLDVRSRVQLTNVLRDHQNG